MRGGGEEATKVVGRLPVIVVGEWHAAIMEWYASIARYCEPSHGVIIMCRSARQAATVIGVRLFLTKGKKRKEKMTEPP
ncbi:hypothetical protein C356_04263 [Cryptococcus neoformans c45]|nr:hypothetical protein C356_04263 [Cryptococcus neoformans var. grubii c45]